MHSMARYVFESNEVRVVVGQDGQPWFVAVDVCQALGIVNGPDAVSRLDPDERNTIAIADGTRGNPNKTIISEPGVYRLVFTSRVEGAERFKRWLAHEVLPSLRRTGSYTAESPSEQPNPIARKVEAHLTVARVLAAGIPGLSVGIAASVALDAIHTDTGLTMEPYRRLLPAAAGPVASLNATAVGKALGLSAAKANALLASRGFQRKGERGRWEVTEEGARYGEMVPYTRNGHSGYQPMWRAAVVQELSVEKSP